VTEDLIQRLNLKRTRNSTPIQGISNAKAEVKHSVNLRFHSRTSNYNVALECLVLPKISGDLPGSYINTKKWNLPKDLHLSDPGFNQPGMIDLLIGTEAYFHILKAGKKTRVGPYPDMQDTEFGWILAGRFQPFQPTIGAEDVLSQKRYQPRAAVTTVLGTGRTESTSTI
jgi:hypothetical protein